MLDDGLWDDNLVISFHKYWNVTTRESIAGILELRDTHDVPLWLGETGENSNDWFARTVALAEGEGIGWARWPLKKIRYTGPLKIVPNEGYRQILAYWRGEGERPSAEEAEAALMRFARHDVRFENNVFHKDVIDALFRAPHSDRSVPYREHLVTAEGGTIAAVDFDMGRNGVAYHDLTPANHHISDGGERVVWNPAMTYRNDGVDLGEDADGGLFVAQMQAGEWLKYTITAARAGSYDLELDTAGKGRASLKLNGERIDEADTDAGFRGLMLLEGRNMLVIGAEIGGFDLKSLDIRPADLREPEGEPLP